MLTETQVKEVKQALEKSQRPFFLFHDDPDGLASFLMLYRHVGKGKGMVIKAYPKITDFFVSKVADYGADTVFILDIALCEQEFIDGANVPVYWIDHHDPQKMERVRYFNPRENSGENIPTPVLCRQITEDGLWQATVGAIGDWHFPHFADEFRKKYPDLLPKNIKTAEKALYEAPIGELIKIFSFVLKGNTSIVRKNIAIMTRIDEPDELLKQTTSRGKFLWKHYKTVLREYNLLLEKAMKSKADNGVLVFTYEQDTLSLTKDLANELLYRIPNTIIVLGRRKSGEFRCSLRANHLNLKELLTKALEGIRGKGGGHEHACGAAIAEEDFAKFVDKLKELS